jgi:lysophospholipid acyltransferase (LPLAT)-like uncharacterized protein
VFCFFSFFFQVPERLYQLVDRSTDGLVTADQVMEFIAGLQAIRWAEQAKKEKWWKRNMRERRKDSRQRKKERRSTKGAETKEKLNGYRGRTFLWKSWNYFLLI